MILYTIMKYQFHNIEMDSSGSVDGSFEYGNEPLGSAQREISLDWTELDSQDTTSNRPPPLRSTLFQIRYLPNELVDTETEILTVPLKHYVYINRNLEKQISWGIKQRIDMRRGSTRIILRLGDNIMSVRCD